jgi:predicted cupin superfamily sugar epimerase
MYVDAMYAGSMKTLIALACLAVSSGAPVAISQQKTPEHFVRPAGNSLGETRSREIIRELNLKVLPKESGYLGLIGSSAQTTLVDGRPIAIQSQVYYMLTRDLPVNYLHWLASDDTHILIEGGPVDYFIFHPDGHVEKITLGLDLAAGERPVVAVPGGCWKALRLHEGATYALMANALSPEFTPDRVKIGAGGDWVKRFAGTAPWATEANLRALIGPNWTGR